MLYRVISFILLLIYLSWPVLEMTALAQESDALAEQIEARRKLLEEESQTRERIRAELAALQEDTKRLVAELGVGQLSQEMVEEARLQLQSAQVRIADLEAEQNSTQRRIGDLEQEIRSLEERIQLLRNPVTDPIERDRQQQQLAALQTELSQKKEQLELESRYLEYMRARLELAKQRLELMRQRLTRIEEVFQRQQEQSRRIEQEDLTARLQKQEQEQLAEVLQLQARMQREREWLSAAQRQWLETRILVAEEQAKIARTDIQLSRAENILRYGADLLERSDVALQEIRSSLSGILQLMPELQSNVDLLQTKLEFITQRRAAIEAREAALWADIKLKDEELSAIDELQTALRERLERAEAALSWARELQTRLEQRSEELFQKYLVQRVQLPTSLNELQQTLQELAAAPQALLYQISLSLESAQQAVSNANPWRQFLLAVVELVLLLLILAAWRGCRLAIERWRLHLQSDDTFVGNAILIALLLLRKNLLSILFVAALLLVLLVAAVPQPGASILLTLALLWLGVKMPINLAWLLLVAPVLPAEYRRVPLYRRLAPALVIGGLLALCMILARLSSLPKSSIESFDWLFMLFLLFGLGIALRIRRYVLWLFERFSGRAWFVSMRLISLLFPLALVATALVGLVGYLNLAWLVSWHLVVFVLVLIAWLVVRGLLNDASVVLKNFAVMHSSYGLLWTQDIITPLHKILELLLFLGAWLVLFGLYGLDDSSDLRDTVLAFLIQPLFSLGNVEFSLWDLAIALFVVFCVIRFARWVRLITYRWILSHILDLGVRHSLSVFIQYAIVLIGLFSVLQLLGLDLTTLTVFAGAVGVGIGFGLQTIANNFISGLILLVERPLRSGDTVQIGSNLGEVTRIGIRSLTMKTWDNTDVILPNSDVISASFTNWTHSDNIVRTVLMISVNFEVDPHRAHAIIKQVVADNADILDEPERMVTLWEFAQSAIVFRVHYFTDFFRANILMVRSQVMFEIYDRFREVGISVYFPQQGVYVREWPEGVAALSTAEKQSPTALLKTKPIG